MTDVLDGLPVQIEEDDLRYFREKFEREFLRNPAASEKARKQLELAEAAFAISRETRTAG